MEKKADLLAVLAAASSAPSASTTAVGRLLTPVELDYVSGADGSGTCTGTSDHTQGSGSFTQNGGDYYQGSNSYTMTCESAQLEP